MIRSKKINEDEIEIAFIGSMEQLFDELNTIITKFNEMEEMKKAPILIQDIFKNMKNQSATLMYLKELCKNIYDKHDLKNYKEKFYNDKC